MPCPTCDHTMQRLNASTELYATWWCPRCGTLKSLFAVTDHTAIDTPSLVGRVRQWLASDKDVDRAVLNLTECVVLPEERKASP